MVGQQPQNVLATLGKSYCAEILVAADKPRSVQELSAELDIPIATCYRRINELTEWGLLESYSRTDDQQATTYQRTTDNVYIDFSDTLTVSITPPSKVQPTLDRLWERVF